jgi:hypothetical protein
MLIQQVSEQILKGAADLAIFVNGQVLLARGEPTGRLPSSVLRPVRRPAA